MSLGYVRIGEPRERGRVSQSLLVVGIAGMVAAAITFAPMAGGAVRSSNSGSPDAGVSESRLAAIYADNEDGNAPASTRDKGLRLASLDSNLTVAALSRSEGQAAADRASFSDRFFPRFGERLSSFEDRFGARTARTEATREPASRPVTRAPAIAAAEPGRDGPMRLDPPKRANTRLAMLTPPDAAPDKASRSVVTDPSRTAIYDITARTVYLPNGERLEAHSGFGEHMDDPRSLRIKMRGVTPPNVYDLTLRERPFHGVRAIRLNPVDGDKMYGRAGILAHTYMLGPSGQSNGCVSFKDYPRFLNAFLNGEIDRLVVVEQLADPPPANTAVGWITDKVKALFKSS